MLYRAMILLILTLSIAPYADAKTIVKLKTGKTVQGELIEKTDEYVKINIDGIEITYWADEISATESLSESSGKKIAASGTITPAPVSTATTQRIKNTVTIKGTISCQECASGSILISAFNKPKGPQRKVIARSKIEKPGPYTLTLPPNSPVVIYVGAFNDVNGDGFAQGDNLIGWYGKPDPSKPIGLNAVSNNMALENIDFPLEKRPSNRPTSER